MMPDKYCYYKDHRKILVPIVNTVIAVCSDWHLVKPEMFHVQNAILATEGLVLLIGVCTTVSCDRTLKVKGKGKGRILL